MKTKNLIERLSLFLLALVLTMPAWAQGTEVVSISSAADWKTFCQRVNHNGEPFLNAKLTQDVDLGGEIVMLGSVSYPYSGTFDGNGHTLKFNWNAGEDNQIAPFYYVENATIKNLRTQGKITTKGYGLSGMVYIALGTTTISGCISDVDITGGDGSWNDSQAAGMVQAVGYQASVHITDCLVKGSITDNADESERAMAGFVFSNSGTYTLTRCLYVGKNNATNDKYSKTFGKDGYGATFTDCYYLHPCGEPQGTQAIEKELRNGGMTKKLHGNRTDKCYWAQVLGDVPNPYFDVDKSKTNYVYYDTANSRWACENFMLTDGQPLPIGIDFIAVKAIYKCPFSNMRSATICLPYELPVQGFKGYTIADGGDNKVFFETVTDMLTAYTPYYIRADSTTPLGGTNLQVKAFKADKMTTPAAGYKFTGTVTGVDNATAAAANAYILQDDGKFHKVTTDYPAATIPAYRAYITYNGSNGAKQLSVVLDGQTTGIGDVTNEATDVKNGPVYDLQGRRVADRLDDATRHQLPAGVYIVGGRKIIVK